MTTQIDLCSVAMLWERMYQAFKHFLFWFPSVLSINFKYFFKTNIIKMCFQVIYVYKCTVMKTIDVL